MIDHFDDDGAMGQQIEARWLPNAAVDITVISTHEDYDDLVQKIKAARDWRDRGEGYVRGLIGADEKTKIIAVFEGWFFSAMGCGVNT